MNVAVIVDRRTALRLAGLTAAFSLIPIASAAAQPGPRFAPPTAPMRYTRRLERGLPDGASLTVDRSFSVRFVPEGDGFRVEGEQVEAAVDAPPSLATLAGLERGRVETGGFPLLLDAAGAIRSATPSVPGAELDDAVREVTAQIERWPHTAAEREQLRAFVTAVHQSAGRLVTELPRDLFAPAGVPREASRAVALPGSEAGRVTTRFTATRDPATGLMREARREVLTAVSGEVRRTLESWTLALA